MVDSWHCINLQSWALPISIKILRKRRKCMILRVLPFYGKSFPWLLTSLSFPKSRLTQPQSQHHLIKFLYRQCNHHMFQWCYWNLHKLFLIQTGLALVHLENISHIMSNLKQNQNKKKSIKTIFLPVRKAFCNCPLKPVFHGPIVFTALFRKKNITAITINTATKAATPIRTYNQTSLDPFVSSSSNCLGGSELMLLLLFSSLVFNISLLKLWLKLTQFLSQNHRVFFFCVSQCKLQNIIYILEVKYNICILSAT